MKLSFITFREYLFYFLVFALPWQTRWIVRDLYVNGTVWEYGRISLYGWDILLVILLVWYWPHLKSELKKISLAPGKPFLVYLFILTLSLLSIFWSIDKPLALVWSLRIMVGGWLWLLVRAIKPKLDLIFVSLLAAGTIQALWAVWQFFTQSTFANKWLGVALHPLNQVGTSVVLASSERWLRAYAGQVHPNVLGGLLVVTLLATAWLYVENAKLKNCKAKLFLLLYAIQLLGLFFSFSRGAWLALLFTLGLWFYKNSNDVWQLPNIKAKIVLIIKKPNFIIVLLTAVLFIILGSIWWQPTLGRIFGGSKLEQQSVEERAGEVGESRNMLSTVWWRGTGLGNYTATLISFQPGLKGYIYQPVHDTFLLILTELGLIGLLLFLWLIYAKYSPFIINHSLFILPIIITSFFDHYWWTIPSMSLLFWLIISLNNAGDDVVMKTPS